ncbi:MAG: ABC transporter permease subunit, partial [Pseudomonadota bacterium]
MTALMRFGSAKGLVGLLLIAAVGVIAALGPVLIPPDFATAMDMRARLSPPTLSHPMGTDQLGRDLMWRVLLGAQTSITIAGLAVAISVLIGLPLGIVSGYFGGLTDNVLMRLVDTLLAFPALLLALTISAVLGPNMQNTILAIGIAFTPFLARIIRGEALR